MDKKFKRIGNSTALTELSHLKTIITSPPFQYFDTLPKNLPLLPDQKSKPKITQKSASCDSIPNLKIHRHKPA